MLRKGIVALMITVMSVASLNADDADGKNQTGLMGLLRRQVAAPANANKQTGSQVQHAVVADAEQQNSGIQQTSNGPRLIQQRPVVPNQSTVSGPQYFSATTPSGQALPLHPGRNWQQYTAPQPVHLTSAGPYRQISNSAPQAASGQMTAPGPGPRTGAALYPAPVPGIPHQVGGTAIPSQFLHPHEMTYAHRYKAIYPPYYYKVNGGWMVTPFGVWSKENWHLQGTQVDVKYKSHISPFAMFKTPVIR